MIGLTPPQARALDAIKRLTRDGVPPSYRQLGEELGMASQSAVHRLIVRLRDRGFVAFEPRKARSLRITEDAKLLATPTRDLRAMRDQIERELRRRAW